MLVLFFSKVSAVRMKLELIVRKIADLEWDSRFAA